MATLKSGDEAERRKEVDEKSEQATIQNLMKALESLQRENEILKRETSTSPRLPSGRIGLTLLIMGALALIGSVASTSAILAFIGLGLTFWGALFLFARPVKFIRSTLLESTAMSSYTTIDRIIQDLNYKGKPIYIPPYPREAYLPEYLKGLKEMVVLIPAQDTLATPTIEEMAKKQFLLTNPKGICISPPGYGLINLFEKELKIEFTRIDLERLSSNLPTVVVRNLELAKELEIDQEDDFTHIRIVDSAYRNLYSLKQGFKSIHSIGCPLTSAIACALAKMAAKSVTIEKDAVSPDLRTMEVWFRTLEA